MLIPACRAASKMVKPFGTERGIPLILIFTISITFGTPSYFLSTAPNLHFCRQTPHLMHLALSITCGFLTLPVIAFTGQLRAHNVQPTHLFSSIVNVSKFLQTPNGHFLSIT